ncbi:hypothetical protein [Actinomadura sp.]|jgi:hypothetical protein|uniref:hypothetical protein n=1 Tax=Actinomadura sp. TaxID=1989 RepID=UPI00335D775C
MEHDPATGEQWSVHVHADNDLTIRDARIAGRDLTVHGGAARAGGAIHRFARRVRPAAAAAAAVGVFAVLLLAAIGLAALLGGR